MMTSRRHMIALMGLAALIPPRAWPKTPQPKPPQALRALRTRFAGRFTGDFDAMLERRLIRLVVPYSRHAVFQR